MINLFQNFLTPPTILKWLIYGGRYQIRTWYKGIGLSHFNTVKIDVLDLAIVTKSQELCPALIYAYDEREAISFSHVSRS